MSEPIIPKELFDRAIGMNEEMREAVMNPNTDFMTKLLFDARYLSKKLGGPHTHYSQAIFSIKMALLDTPRQGAKELAKHLKIPEKEVSEIIGYLLPMAEIRGDARGGLSLNAANPFSRMFREE